MSDPILVQLQTELSRSLSAVALLDAALARSILDTVREAALSWSEALAAGVTPATAEGIVEALHPGDGPPTAWWLSPLGRRLVELGVTPAGELSVRVVAEELGWSRYKASKVFGGGPVQVAAVLAVADSE